MREFIGRITSQGTIEFNGDEADAMMALEGRAVRVTLMDVDAMMLSNIADVQMLPYAVVAESLHHLQRFHHHEALHEYAESDLRMNEEIAGKEREKEGVQATELNAKGYVVETDVLADYLLRGPAQSAAGRLLSRVMCYTTYVNVSEILSMVDPALRDACLKALAPFRMLGMHPRYSTDVAEMLAGNVDEDKKPAEMASLREATVAAIARRSALPVLTVRFGMVYSRLNISTINPDALRLFTTT